MKRRLANKSFTVSFGVEGDFSNEQEVVQCSVHLMCSELDKPVHSIISASKGTQVIRNDKKLGRPKIERAE